MKRIAFITVLCAFIAAPASADLLGTYYNLSDAHPDMETPITGVVTGLVETTLTGPSPTLSASASGINQFDWWSGPVSFSRVDTNADLVGNFAPSWFPVSDGTSGDPYHFAVHWEGLFNVGTGGKTVNYSMESDDDAWLFIDNQLVIDLGGIHDMAIGSSGSFTLAPGVHEIDIFFAERHVVESGFRLTGFDDAVVPVPGAVLLGMLGLSVAGVKLRKWA